jgi:hypothetical protein
MVIRYVKEADSTCQTSRKYSISGVILWLWKKDKGQLLGASSIRKTPCTLGYYRLVEKIAVFMKEEFYLNRYPS